MEEGSTRADYDRTWSLVGLYMYEFALLEAAVDDAIGKLLSIEPLQNQILARNIEFSRKIYILKSVASLGLHQKTLTGLLNKISKASEVRNVVAHNVFGPDKGGINFLTVAARSELRFPETYYTTEQFMSLIGELADLRDGLASMVSEMTKPNRNVLEAIARGAHSPPV